MNFVFFFFFPTVMFHYYCCYIYFVQSATISASVVVSVRTTRARRAHSSKLWFIQPLNSYDCWLSPKNKQTKKRLKFRAVGHTTPPLSAVVALEQGMSAEATWEQRLCASTSWLLLWLWIFLMFTESPRHKRS